MRKLRMNLEAVTPIFLGGASPRGAPELRAPSFRGAMRYWLRALTGAACKQTMRQYEKDLFGAGGDDKAPAGVVNLRLISPSNVPTQSYSGLVTNRLGTAYLWFAARGTKHEKERHAILPMEFTLELSVPRSRQPDKDLKQAAAVLWLLSRLGGIGARSRRFTGGIQICAVKSPYDDGSIIANLPVRADSPQELADELSAGIQEVRQLFDIQKLASSAPSLFDVLHPERCQILVLNRLFTSWKDAVEEIGQRYRSFRQLRQPDYHVVKNAMASRQDLDGTVERAAFGLPIPFFYRSLGKRTATLQARTANEKIDRRASPLWMRLVKLSNGKYAAVFTWFKSRFLPQGAKFLLSERRKPDLDGEQLPHDQLISLFLEGSDNTNRSSLKDAGYDLLEVTLG